MEERHPRLLAALVTALLVAVMLWAGTSDYHDRYDHMTDVDRAYLESIGEIG